MRVKDAAGEYWSVRRRWTPWHRLVQPFNIASGGYSRYRVGPETANLLDRAKTRRSGRKQERETKREERKITGWHWLYMAPVLVVTVLVVGFAAQVLEALIYLVAVVIWLVLLPFYFVELLARFLAGIVLWLARVVGMARSRVDVVGGLGQVKSLTKTLVPGYGSAGHLVRALTDQRRTSSVPFDPRDPSVGTRLTGARAEVTEHASVWATPSPMVTPR
ncbi:hypothetical protein [Amycolatopsis sp.]|uniref:hypothetical protein n=1 Tax=Amycolatopsis sp. TaxID=37632 RepID=UPI002BB1B514|nr:hypothetical protein [Amycolatopsis sp.]HVV14179.1 hypothetical protein [Amycolatopsis sp.]